MTSLAVANATTGLESYAYTVDNAGHRTSVTEKSGRTVNYSYDTIYRLTNETIAGDPNGINGSVSYTYDNVGNRLQKSTALPSTYNANDELTTDQYDANGNTIGSGQNTGTSGYVYDFENRLVQQGGITLTYDGNGNLLRKAVGGTVTKTYVVAEINPTGYPQVMAETSSPTNGTVQVGYVYGLELEYRGQGICDPTCRTIQSYYVHDGHGSVRALTDQNGNITDTYDYDAFGVLTHSSGTTANSFLFAGELYDPDLKLYYNRARYLNTSTGRFWTMDTYEGDSESPLSLHKYLYANASPVDDSDPTGYSAAELTVAAGVGETLDAMIALNVLRVLTAVVSTLLITTGVNSLLTTPSATQDTSGRIVKARAAAKTAVDEAVDALPRQPSRILYHYGSPDEVQDIYASGQISVAPASGRFSSGAFATDLAGYLAESVLTRSQLTKIIFGQNENDLSKTAWYVAFVEQPMYTFRKVAPFIYFYPGSPEVTPLAYGPTLLGGQ